MHTKKLGGRPKGIKQGSILHVRVSERDKAEIEERARIAGLSVSGYVRQQALGGLNASARR